jgi:hypothetical protein
MKTTNQNLSELISIRLDKAAFESLVKLAEKEERRLGDTARRIMLKALQRETAKVTK